MAEAVREILDRFHDERLEVLRPLREEQKNFIILSSEPVVALQTVQTGLFGRVARFCAEQRQTQKTARIIRAQSPDLSGER